MDAPVRGSSHDALAIQLPSSSPVNLGRYSVGLYVDFADIEWFWGADHLVDDEDNCFVIQKFDSDERRYPEGWKVSQFLKDERISEVILTRDTIKTSKGKRLSPSLRLRDVAGDEWRYVFSQLNGYATSATFIFLARNMRSHAAP